jgi:hypothetical protein
MLDPFKRVTDPNRRAEYYNFTMPTITVSEFETRKGFAWAIARIAGIVRVLTNPEEGEKL